MTFNTRSHRAVGGIPRSCTILIAAMLVSLVLSAAAQAAPGDLDPTFSGDGVQTTPFLDDAQANDVAIQGNGKIVVVGRATSIDQPADYYVDYFAVARYNLDGSLDPTFSGDGLQTTEMPCSSCGGANGVASQRNGKIVAVGSSHSGFALARYNPGGKLDIRQTINYVSGSGRGVGNAVAIQPNGKIVVVGGAVARFNSNGTLDKTFSGDGRQLLFGGRARAFDVAIQANGKIVVVGTIYNNNIHNANDFAVARYNPNGTLDKSFSGDGQLTTNFVRSDYDEGAHGVAIQGSRIVAVGVTSSPVGDHQNENFALARYRANGTLDPTFSGDGKQTADLSGCCGGNDVLEDVAVQPNGKIVAAGYSSHLGYGLARYTFHGSLDPTFSGDGLQTIDYGIGYAQGASAVALQGDGKIVVVGSSPNGYVDDFALARYLGG
jgi:uncharacterized delta-60 repeat protein